METFRVTYQIDIDANTHKEAANTAFEWLSDNSSMRPIFKVEVTDKNGKPIIGTVEFIDLQKD